MDGQNGWFRASAVLFTVMIILFIIFLLVSFHVSGYANYWKVFGVGAIVSLVVAAVSMKDPDSIRRNQEREEDVYAIKYTFLK